ncbi:hypothetical protein Ccrd_012489 [Cynara cardunculus var. scolymus]|uniref:Transmembrane protein n=1 Tax=Cynara cardunculus var. scolymus TaxID=59895 RepID=A0A103YHC7_CYNCS|nr:hypothetical protein Ccrd_012489 [Cynara cardunculus var. scolymus]
MVVGLEDLTTIKEKRDVDEEGKSKMRNPMWFRNTAGRNKDMNCKRSKLNSKYMKAEFLLQMVKSVRISVVGILLFMVLYFARKVPTKCLSLPKGHLSSSIWVTGRSTPSSRVQRSPMFVSIFRI